MASIKQEPIDPGDVGQLEQRILSLCDANPTGLPDTELQRQVPDMDVKVRAMAVNKLLAKNQIELLKNNQGLVYKRKTAPTTSAIPGVDREEKLVFQTIVESENKGIWIRDIRTKCELPQAQLQKILRNLETKKFIKSVKTVGVVFCLDTAFCYYCHAMRKKVYMKFDLQPDASVTGGTFYSDQELDVEFANILSAQCFKFLGMRAESAKQKYPEPWLQRKMSFASPDELLVHIKELKISNLNGECSATIFAWDSQATSTSTDNSSGDQCKIDLKPKDVQAILDTLVWDAKAESALTAGGSRVFRSLAPAFPDSGVVRVPCGICPVFKDCRPGYEISPASCEYLRDWLAS